ncbi:MAG: hypothetical protein Q9N32_05860 [Gammaproteobacteria bacterium]|nr:hypothetical protein [Gammaproteobacteria bacterium]
MLLQPQQGEITVLSNIITSSIKENWLRQQWVFYFKNGGVIYVFNCG